MVKKDVMVTLKDRECHHLKYQKGMPTCDIQNNKPPFCKMYPSSPSDLIEGCGYGFVETENNKVKVPKRH